MVEWGARKCHCQNSWLLIHPASPRQGLCTSPATHTPLQRKDKNSKCAPHGYGLCSVQILRKGSGYNTML